MKSNFSSKLVIFCILLFIINHSIPKGIATRKLAQVYPNGFFSPNTAEQPAQPPPTPVNEATYHSQTKNGAHTQTVTVNGKTESESTSIQNNHGTRVIEESRNHHSEHALINGKNGKPQIVESHNHNSETEIIYGNNGKPQIESHKYDNGTTSVNIGGYHYNFQSPTGTNGNFFSTPPAN